jgi:hypothetical protein
VRKHGPDVFREFVDYVMREKGRQWPDLATLTGAFNAFEDPFLARIEDRNQRQEQAQRERREQDAERQLRDGYANYLDPLIARMKRRQPERYAAFERQVAKSPDHRRALAKAKQYDAQDGPLSKAARELAEREARALFNVRFIRAFQDQGIMDFEIWKSRQDDAATDLNRHAA